MSIQDSDFPWKYSTKSGSAGNSQAQTDPHASLGKYISTTQWTGGVANDLFRNVGGDENRNMASKYRSVFLHNAHATLTAENVTVWISGPRCTANASTDVITATDGPAGYFEDGMAVRVEAELTGDVLPTGLSSGVTYYVRDVSWPNFKLAATLGGPAIDITSAGGSFAVRKHFGATEAIGLDTTAASAVGSSSAQALEVANEDTAPSGVSFSTPYTKASGINLGTIANGQCRALWVRRTGANTAAVNKDGIFLRREWDTPA